MFCTRCGTEVNQGPGVCPRCGTPVAADAMRMTAANGRPEPAGVVSPKSRLATALLAFFLGGYGAHRFYAGKTRTAILMLAVTVAAFVWMMGLGLFLATTATAADMETGFVHWGLRLGMALYPAPTIWALVDFIFIVAGRFKDGQGRLIKR